MMRIAFLTAAGSVFWAECEGLSYDELEGYTLDNVRENSRGTGPCSQITSPANWKVIRVEAV